MINSYINTRTTWLVGSSPQKRFSWIITSFILLFLNNSYSQSYCIPPVNGSSCFDGDNITSVSLGTLNEPSLSCSPEHEDRSSIQNATPDLTEGLTYSMSVGVGDGGTENVGVWIDFNKNGTFESTEYFYLGSGYNSIVTDNITIPYGVTPGITKMRVRNQWLYDFTGNDACDYVDYGTTRDYNVNLIAATPCSGTPTATILTSSGQKCANIPFVLQGNQVQASGITYQWQSSPAGANNWSSINGATSVTYNVANGIISATDYRLIVICTNGNDSSISTPITLNITPANQCYCTPPVSTYTDLYWIESVNTTGGFINISNLNTGQSPNTYADYTNSDTVLVAPGSTFDFSVDSKNGSFPGIKIWIDWNQSGSFDANEEVFASTSGNSSATNTYTGTISIPGTALTGSTRMRIRNYTSITPCDQQSYGEAEDYTLTIQTQPACTGQPNAGTINQSGTALCANTPFTLTAGGYTIAGDMTYQWQQNTGGNWTDINGANSSNLSLPNGITTATDYRFVVTCNATSDIDSTSSVSITIKPANQCYCTPTTSSSSSYYITNFTTTGGTVNINKASTNDGTGYQDFSATDTLKVLEGNTINYSINVAGGSTYGRAIWIDFNEDGQFDATEQVASSNSYLSSPLTGSFNIPLGTSAGVKRMRILASWFNMSPSNPCTETDDGEYEDYMIEVIALTPCAGNPSADIVTTSHGVCANVAFTLEANQIPASGITYQWQSSTDSLTWNNLGTGSATAYSYDMANGITTATYYRVIVTCVNDLDTSNVIKLTINPANQCYCTPTTTSSSSYYITNFTTTGGTVDINKTSTNNSIGYQDFSTTDTLKALEGSTINYSIDVAGGSNYGHGIWVDWNEDGQFASNEQVVISSSYIYPPITGSFTIPLGTSAGNKRMRVLASYTPSNPTDPCANSGNGEYEDYMIEVTSLTACTGAPDADLVSTSGAVCENVAFTLEGVPVQSGNITYQWQQSPAGVNNWFNVQGASSYTYNMSNGISTPTDYRLVVTCVTSNQVSYSDTLSYTIKPTEQCYCTPHYDFVDSYINGVTTTGGDININNSPNGAYTGGYADYYDTDSLVMTVGGSATLEFELVTSLSAGVSIYVDMNNDGQFTQGSIEQIYTSGSYLYSGTYQLQIDIPTGIIPGTYRARIVTDYYAMDPSPCPDDDEGEAEDYKIVILPLCTNPVVNLGSDTTICAETSLVLNAGNPNLTHAWSTQDTTQTITVNTSGTYSVTVTDGQCSTSDTITITVNSNPSVTASASVTILCAGENSVLTAGGADSYVWLDDNSTANPRTVTPTQTTTYSVEGTTNGCSNTATVSVIVKDNSDCDDTGLENIQLIKLNVYPNPANSVITISGTKLTHYFTDYAIVDLTGRTISNEKIQTDELTIDITNIVDGIYFINLNGTIHKAIKIEVKH